jgi:integrase
VAAIPREELASLAVSTLHAIFEHGVRLGMIDVNPARGVRKIAEQRRDRRLSEQEIVRLGLALSELEAAGECPTGVAAIRFLALTGFRRMEALALETEWLDPTLLCVRFPDTKSGKQTRMIGRAAARLAKALCSRTTTRYLFPADLGEGHFIGAPRVLARVTARARLENVTIHTLRHTFASIGGELGFSELTLAGLLGHASRGVTQRYVHLDEALIVAADRISERIAILLGQGMLRAESSVRRILPRGVPTETQSKRNVAQRLVF